MQSIKRLARALDDLSGAELALFTLNDLRCLLPGRPLGALKVLVGRAEKAGLLGRVCRGLYLYPRVFVADGLLLYRAAARLRADRLNYLSLESVLSDAGVISQIPMNWITVMSSGRSRIVDCGGFGRIEFIHTKKHPAELHEELTYDPRCGLWRASVALALRDMKSARRSLDLVDRESAHEFV